MLKNEKEIIRFVIDSNKREGLCKDHAVSEFVIDHWAEIATECYINTKAQNLAKLLDVKEWEPLTGIVYATGKHIEAEKEKAEGWKPFFTMLDTVKDGMKLQVKSQGSLFERVLEGKLIKNGEKWGLLPKGKRTRGIWLNYQLVRAV